MTKVLSYWLQLTDKLCSTSRNSIRRVKLSLKFSMINHKVVQDTTATTRFIVPKLIKRYCIYRMMYCVNRKWLLWTLTHSTVRCYSNNDKNCHHRFTNRHVAHCLEIHCQGFGYPQAVRPSKVKTNCNWLCFTVGWKCTWWTQVAW